MRREGSSGSQLESASGVQAGLACPVGEEGWEGSGLAQGGWETCGGGGGKW